MACPIVSCMPYSLDPSPSYSVTPVVICVWQLLVLTVSHQSWEFDWDGPGQETLWDTSNEKNKDKKNWKPESLCSTFHVLRYRSYKNKRVSWVAPVFGTQHHPRQTLYSMRGQEANLCGSLSRFFSFVFPGIEADNVSCLRMSFLLEYLCLLLPLSEGWGRGMGGAEWWDSFESHSLIVKITD